MDLSHHIDEIRAGIRIGRYGSEASVSQGIVLRLLQALDWPTFETRIVYPQFSLGGLRVDYALCHPANKPVAFVEVKKIGQSDGAERQLFEYAFHEGVPLAVLTDGQEWNFFLPAGQGDYSERRVYKLDIVERELSESVNRLERYLGHERVSSGEALDAATADYRNASRNRQVASMLPEAWRKLLAEEDEMMVEILSDKVESLSGFKPDVDSVAKFLRQQVTSQSDFSRNKFQETVRTTPPASEQNRQTRRISIEPVAESGVSNPNVGYSLNGQLVPCRNGRDVLVGVFEALAARDPSFLDRFASRPKHGRTRRYLAPLPEQLYPGRPDLAAEHFSKLKSGWYVGTNVSHAQIERIIEMACEVAGLKFGRDLTINVGA